VEKLSRIGILKKNYQNRLRKENNVLKIIALYETQLRFSSKNCPHLRYFMMYRTCYSFIYPPKEIQDPTMSFTLGIGRKKNIQKKK